MKNSALNLLLSNREKASKKFGFRFLHTPPNPDHYPHLYLWDSSFCAIVFSRLKEPQYAIQEINEIFKGMDKYGFIPGTRFVARSGRRLDPERFFFKRKNFGSDYSQPPIIALAVYETYKNLNKKNKKQANSFLKENFPKLKLFYEYFLHQRKNQDGLIYCIHPHETGRDSDPIFDKYKIRLPRNGVKTFFVTNFLNTFLDYTSALSINYKKNFILVDMMFNCMLVDNLRILSDISKIISSKKNSYFQKEADKLEQLILKKYINEEVISISQLFPIILKNIPHKQLENIVNLLEDQNFFNTPYPIPSVSVNNKNFDPHYTEKGRVWRGPTWINTNWYLVERGLLMQLGRKDVPPNFKKRIKKLAENIKKSSQSLTKNGYFEFYDPFTGAGYRIKNFAWSTLSAVFT